MAFVLSPGQDAAITMVGKFLDQEEERVALITGFAGTGKTTTIRILDQAYETSLVIATPTGKSALRVTEATGLPASTIHRLLYQPKTNTKTGEPIFVLKSQHDLFHLAGALVLVDEASMVDQQVWIDLAGMSRRCDFKIILMGDRFQLPPVTRSEENFSALDVPTSFSVNLTEVIRQAQDSPIIKASMILRSGRPIFEALQFLRPVAASKLIPEALRLWHEGGVLLVHRNITRHKVNTDVREALGYEEGSLQPGEPLLILQNNYKAERYNGEIVRFDSWDSKPSKRTTQTVYDPYKATSLEMSFGVASVSQTAAMLSPEEIVGKVETAGVGHSIIRKTAEKLHHLMDCYGTDPPPYLHANYGYALTVHKAQGSEWPEVLILMESSLQAMTAVEQKRHLYTAITRSKERCSFVYLPD